MLFIAAKLQGAVPVTKIASGCEANQSYVVTADGLLWGMGVSYFSQNGLELPIGYYNFNRPEQILLTNVTAVAGGGAFNSELTGFVYMLTTDGTVWGSGAPGSVEITNGYTNPLIPVAIDEVEAVAAGGLHGLFLRADGSLWGVGNDESGQLGDGRTYSATPSGPYIPEQIIASDVKAIAAGGWHSLFLKTDGSLWGMGSDVYGQLGDGRVYYEDGPGLISTNLPVLIVPDNVVAISAGAYHSLFLKSDGSLWGMGYNFYGQLGLGNFWGTNRPALIVASNVVAVAAGGYHSLFLMSDGSLWGMGMNTQGQLGDGSYTNWPPPANGVDVPEMIVASNVVAIAAGQYHSLFLKSDGSLWAMGQNTQGQLGDGFWDSGSFPGSDEPEQVYPLPEPQLVQTISGGTDLQFAANCGFGGTFYLLSSTNLALPSSQWTPVWTNDIMFRYENQFSATLSNVIPTGGPQQFFRLQAE